MLIVLAQLRELEWAGQCMERRVSGGERDVAKFWALVLVDNE